MNVSTANTKNNIKTILKNFARIFTGKRIQYIMFLSVVIASSFLAYVYTIASRRLTVNLFLIAINSENDLQVESVRFGRLTSSYFLVSQILTEQVSLFCVFFDRLMSHNTVAPIIGGITNIMK